MTDHEVMDYEALKVLRAKLKEENIRRWNLREQFIAGLTFKMATSNSQVAFTENMIRTAIKIYDEQTKKE